MLPIRRYLDRFRLIPLFVVSHFSHHVITAIIVPLLPFIRSEFGLSYAQSGLLFSAFALSNGISQLPAGWLADRIGPKVLILVGISGVAVGGMLVGLSTSYLMAAAALVVVGVAAGGYHPSAAPLISSSVDSAYVGKALGLHLIGGSTSYFLAPLLGVGLAAFWGWRGAYLVLSAPVFAVGVVLYILLLRRNVDAREAAQRVRGSGAASGPRPEHAPSADPKKRGALPLLLLVLSMTIVSRIVGGSLISFIPLYLVDYFGVGENTAGVFLAFIFSAGFYAAPLGGHIADRIGPLRLLLVLGLVHGPILILLILVPFGWGFAALLMLIGVQMFMRMPTAESLIIGGVPVNIRSTVLGIYFFVGTEASGILTPILGGMIDGMGFRPTFAIVSTVVSASAVLCFLAYLILRRRRDGPVS